jgi:type IV pilus assembly protein PilN
MRFEINLASQPTQDVQRFLLRWSLAVLVAVLVTAGLVYAASSAFFSWRVTEREVHSLQQQISKRDQQKAEVQAFLNRPENRETRDRSQFLNALFARKAFSWTEVFTDLEKIVPPGIHVVGMHPAVNDKNELELHLSTSGRTRDTATELVHRLEQSSHFSNAQILSETTVQQQNRPPSFSFEISAIYIPSFARTLNQAAGDEKSPASPSPASAATSKPSAPGPENTDSRSAGARPQAATEARDGRP